MGKRSQSQEIERYFEPTYSMDNLPERRPRRVIPVQSRPAASNYRLESRFGLVPRKWVYRGIGAGVILIVANYMAPEVVQGSVSKAQTVASFGFEKVCGLSPSCSEDHGLGKPSAVTSGAEFHDKADVNNVIRNFAEYKVDGVKTLADPNNAGKVAVGVVAEINITDADKLAALNILDENGQPLTDPNRIDINLYTAMVSKLATQQECVSDLKNIVSEAKNHASGLLEGNKAVSTSALEGGQNWYELTQKGPQSVPGFGDTTTVKPTTSKDKLNIYVVTQGPPSKPGLDDGPLNSVEC